MEIGLLEMADRDGAADAYWWHLAAIYCH